jgi:hypothetical protein
VRGAPIGPVAVDLGTVPGAPLTVVGTTDRRVPAPSAAASPRSRAPLYFAILAAALPAKLGCGSTPTGGSGERFDSGAVCTGDASAADASEPETPSAVCVNGPGGGVVIEPTASLPSSHRASALACCPNLLSPPTDISCATNSDCPTSSGVCLWGKCSADHCFSDSDCPAGSGCACWAGGFGDTPYNTCVPRDCTTDCDCPGGLCVETHLPECFRQPIGFRCWTPSDECVAETVCGSNGFCEYDTILGRWMCVAGGGLCGG